MNTNLTHTLQPGLFLLSEPHRNNAHLLTSRESVSYSVCAAVSLPKLEDLEWRVDMKMASDSVSRMAVPTCILHMKV